MICVHLTSYVCLFNYSVWQFSIDILTNQRIRKLETYKMYHFRSRASHSSHGLVRPDHNCNLYCSCGSRQMTKPQYIPLCSSWKSYDKSIKTKLNCQSIYIMFLLYIVNVYRFFTLLLSVFKQWDHYPFYFLM